MPTYMNLVLSTQPRKKPKSSCENVSVPIYYIVKLVYTRIV